LNAVVNTYILRSWSLNTNYIEGNQLVNRRVLLASFRYELSTLSFGQTLKMESVYIINSGGACGGSINKLQKQLGGSLPKLIVNCAGMRQWLCRGSSATDKGNRSDADSKWNGHPQWPGKRVQLANSDTSDK